MARNENMSAGTTLRAYRLKIDPNEATAEAFARSAGSCRWLWNHLLAMQIEGNRIALPKTGAVRFRAGLRPEGRIVAGAVARREGDGS